jgi:hypothetical protein
MSEHPAVRITKAFVFSVEGPIILALLIAGAFWSGTPSGRSFWGEMACRGHLFPKWIERKDSKVRGGLETPREQQEAYERAAWHVGVDEHAAKAMGQSAAALCNEKGAK